MTVPYKMVKGGEFEKTAVFGWVLDDDQLAQIFLLDVKGMAKEKVTEYSEDDLGKLSSKLYDEFILWRMENFYGGDHSQPKIHGISTDISISDEVMLEWLTLEDMIKWQQQIVQKIEDLNLSEKVYETDLVKKYPSYFENKPTIYLANCDCLCCN